jgi:hypothetical protein
MPARFSTYYLPDDGINFTPGGRVRVDQSSDHVSIIKDPDGDYEIMGHRPATEFREDPPLVRVDLKRVERVSLPWSEPGAWSAKTW